MALHCYLRFFASHTIDLIPQDQWCGVDCACVKMGRYKDSLIGEMDGCEVILIFFCAFFFRRETVNLITAQVQGLL